MGTRGLVLALSIGVVTLGGTVALPPPAFAFLGYEPGTPTSFGGPGSGAGELEGPEGVAVNDLTAEVYVVDKGNNRVEYFSSTGTYIGQFNGTEIDGAPAGAGKEAPSKLASPSAIAIDDATGPAEGDVYVTDVEQVGGSPRYVVDKFTATGEYISQLKETTGGALFTTLRGVAVDHAGNLWVYDENVTEEQPNVDEFSETGVFVPGNSFNTGKGTEPAFAVESSSAVYLVPGAENVRKFDAGVEQLEFSGESRALSINPSNGDIVVDQGHDVQLYTRGSSPSEIPSLQQTFAAGNLAESHGIAASASALYATQRVADTVEVFSFGELKPVVEGESVSGAGSSSATLHGVVRAQGAVTSYYFEYGTSTAYGSRTPVESAGAGTSAVSVSATIEGLQADTAYHFHLVAVNANGERQGSDGMFSTFPVGVLGLPDGRGYELVSSLDSGDAEVTGGVRAAGDGSAVSFAGQAPPVGGNGNSANPHEGGISGGGDNTYLAERSGSGWSASDIQPDGLDSVQYQAFSSDLSLGILSSAEAVTEGAPDSEALYSRNDSDGSYRLLGAGASYGGSTPDGSDVLVSDGSGGLYESVGGGLDPVNVLPEGGSAANAVFGAPSRNENPAKVSPALFGPDLNNVISDDGSRIFWTETDGEGNPLRLFMSKGTGSSGKRTVQLDASQNPGSGGGHGRFWTASSDGSRVFLTDCYPLTPDSKAVPPESGGIPSPSCEKEEEPHGQPFKNLAGNELFECYPESGSLFDLTVDHNPSENADVVGVLGASGDGSYVYFAAGGVLANGAKHEECLQGTIVEIESQVTTLCNVYLVHNGEAPVFVAAVSNEEWSDWATVVGEHSAYVASGGGDLVFDSARDLTGFVSGGADEIYMYTPGAGLSCLSCNPGGVPTSPGTGARLSESDNLVFALRDVSADGDRVFFDSSEGLVPQDENGQEDVYEWERDGTGSCARAAGCLFLFSGGTSTSGSRFVDASENGDDVFFVSRAQLVARDHGEYREVYDARVGAPAEVAPSVCTGTGCQGVPGAPPVFSTPSSATFTGTGNFHPSPPPKGVVKRTVAQLRAEALARALGVCRKDRSKKKRAGCEKAAREKYGPKPAKKSGKKGKRVSKGRGVKR